MTGSRQLVRTGAASGTDRSGTPPSGPPTDAAAPEEARPRERALTSERDGIEAEALLALLDDDYVQGILGALSGEPRSASELADACDASRPTVYRRLNRLEESGLVTAEVELHRKGHHRKVFASTFERATFELVDGTPRVRLVVTETDPGPERPLPRREPAD